MDLMVCRCARRVLALFDRLVSCASAAVDIHNAPARAMMSVQVFMVSSSS